MKEQQYIENKNTIKSTKKKASLKEKRKKYLFPNSNKNTTWKPKPKIRWQTKEGKTEREKNKGSQKTSTKNKKQERARGKRWVFWSSPGRKTAIVVVCLWKLGPSSLVYVEFRRRDLTGGETGHAASRTVPGTQTDTRATVLRVRRTLPNSLHGNIGARETVPEREMSRWRQFREWDRAPWETVRQRG